MTENDIYTLFQAFRYFHETTDDGSEESREFFNLSGDFFRRLQVPGYRMSIGERENCLMMLTTYIQAHPLASQPQRDLHRRIYAGSPQSTL